ncbi:hypothetical protein E4U30_003113 [Claviceps sp. LM220 group G6]|nr:hypothetical protein E4U15_002359 [Claviceps sp. LM218 group G6]KAG6094701.1 hypothetical protein E4U30_003113 [Claviceps sp. LM220 group G6]KAG6109225.1 hypothetical protein E4U14_003303 [Claviceps sp. LM454 group G7]
MPTIYSSLYSSFIRQGSTFAKSITTHGYAQSVVAATHPHVLNSQNRPVFGRRHPYRLGRLSNLHLHSAFHTERTGGQRAEQTSAQNHHGGLDAYYENLQISQAAAGEPENEWTQFEFPKRIEWKPSSSSVLHNDESAAAAEAAAEAAETVVAPESRSVISAEDQAVLAHVDALLEREVEARKQLEATEEGSDVKNSSSPPLSRVWTPVSETSRTPGAALDEASQVDAQSQPFADRLLKLSQDGQHVEIPAVFEAMVASGATPTPSAYNALLSATMHLPIKRIEVVSKALDVFADMKRRRVAPDCDTYDILVGLLASRSLEVSHLKAALEVKRKRFGGMDQEGKFMLDSHELEYAILCEDDRLDLAIELFGNSIDADVAMYSAETYHHLISACAASERVSDMLRLFEHMESNKKPASSSLYSSMITAFAKNGNLVSAVECYTEYRDLAIAADKGRATTLLDRLDAEVYAAVINAYIVSDKDGGAKKFYNKIVKEYGERAAEYKDAMVRTGFVKGLINRRSYEQAFAWARAVQAEARTLCLIDVATNAADDNAFATATEVYNSIVADPQTLATPTVALLAMSIRTGDVASANKYWHLLTTCRATSSFIEPTAMYAVALIGSGQVVEGLVQSKAMFHRIRQSALQDPQSQVDAEIEEGVDFIRRYMDSREIKDPRRGRAQQTASLAIRAGKVPAYAQTMDPEPDRDFDPHAHNVDIQGSFRINQILESPLYDGASRVNDALECLHSMRRARTHPRYITYAKLITAASREKAPMDLCLEILEFARTDVAPLYKYATVRFGWTAILDAMIGACLTLGYRGRAENYHDELLQMGSRPSANTYGLYITTLKDADKPVDEAGEALRIFHKAKADGVQPTAFLYNALIGKLGKARRIEECLLYFQEMRSLNVNLTSVTYGTVINALCRVGDYKMAEDLFHEMEAQVNYRPRPAPYNSIMQFFLTTKRDKAKVVEYYHRMQSRRIEPTSHTYKLLIDTHATLEPFDIAAADALVETMRSSGQAQSVHYASLIHARGCILDDMEGAKKLFDTVVSDRLVRVDALLYQALFEAMVANHRVEETEAVLTQMRDHRIALSPYIANTLIRGWSAQNNVDKARQFFDAVPMYKREPSTYEAMTRAYLSAQQHENAEDVVEEMRRRGFPYAVAKKIIDLVGGGRSS